MAEPDANLQIGMQGSSKAGTPKQQMSMRPTYGPAGRVQARPLVILFGSPMHRLAFGLGAMLRPIGVPTIVPIPAMLSIPSS